MQLGAGGTRGSGGGGDTETKQNLNTKYAESRRSWNQRKLVKSARPEEKQERWIFLSDLAECVSSGMWADLLSRISGNLIADRIDGAHFSDRNWRRSDGSGAGKPVQHGKRRRSQHRRPDGTTTRVDETERLIRIPGRRNMGCITERSGRQMGTTISKRPEREHTMFRTGGNWNRRRKEGRWVPCMEK